MSHAIVFLPGIMGSELTFDDETVWPPKAQETVFGYKRLDKLTSNKVRVKGIIRKVACFGFYESVLDYFEELGFEPGGTDRRLVALAYDWRLDLFTLADQLAGQLDKIDSDRITITAHSMGGLISRLLLESGRYNGRTWYNRVDMLVTMSTPHLGAPLALARAMGLSSALGISAADFKKLSAHPDYPSGYQLLPAPGEDAAWDVDEDGRLIPLDIYDPATAKDLGLSQSSLDRTKALHAALGKDVPEHVRYFYFAGTGHKTMTRLNVVRQPDGKVLSAKIIDHKASGDGTVPIWSSLPKPTQKHLVVDEHATVFAGGSFKNVFFQLFGVNIGPLERTGAELTYSVSQPVYHLSDPETAIEAVLRGEDGIRALKSEILVQEVGEDQTPKGEGQSYPLTYDGPALKTLTLDIDLPEKAGFYRLILRDLSDTEAPREIGDGVVFSVSQ